LSAGAPSLANAIHHSEHLADRAAMLVMGTMINFSRRQIWDRRVAPRLMNL